MRPLFPDVSHEMINIPNILNTPPMNVVWTLDADFPVSIYRRRWQTLADADPEWRLHKIHSTSATWRWSTTLFLDNWLETASRLNLNVLSLSFYHNLGLCLLHPTILTNSFFRQVSGQITAGLTCTRHWWTCARLHRGPPAASTPTRSRQVCFQGNNPINESESGMYIKTPLDPNAPSLQVHHVHWHVPSCVRNICFHSPRDCLSQGLANASCLPWLSPSFGKCVHWGNWAANAFVICIRLGSWTFKFWWLGKLLKIFSSVMVLFWMMVVNSVDFGKI